MQSSFSFTYVELLALPTASLINNPGHLSTGEFVFVGKKRLNTMCGLESNSKVKAAVEFISLKSARAQCAPLPPGSESQKKPRRNRVKQYHSKTELLNIDLIRDREDG